MDFDRIASMCLSPLINVKSFVVMTLASITQIPFFSCSCFFSDVNSLPHMADLDHFLSPIHEPSASGSVESPKLSLGSKVLDTLWPFSISLFRDIFDDLVVQFMWC